MTGLAGTTLNIGGLLDVILPQLPDDASAMLCSAVSHTVYAFSASVTWWGTGFLYRSKQTWSTWLSRLGIAVLSVVAIAVIVAGGYQDRAQHLRDHWVTPFYWVGLVVRLGGYVWSAGEALVYFLMQRRGLKYGLSDPLTTLQFLWWSISNGGMVAILGIAALARCMTGFGPMHLPGGQLFIAIVGITATAAAWFAFFPPGWIVRRMAQGNDPQVGA